ncbi:uncharacterized protein PG986_001969 [Apiospora aurea]|uniref:Uncharacterized protein n=1 Tax=Apiospora aurea TaxID=335848 RepID=A0ABR1QYC3_9PEZI
MAPPKLETLANELKVMILKETDAASILSLISASPTYYRIFYAYYNEILEHSVSDCRAAENAVRYWKERKFAFAPAAPSRPPAVGCTVPGYPASRFLLRHGVTLAKLGSYIAKFIADYAAKARCDPLKDFYVYNSTPEWAHKTLKTKKKTSPIGPNRRLSKDELVKFQRAFFRFEFYARVHAHLESAGEYRASKNPLIQLAPSEAEEVACAYGYLYSLQMLVVDEIEPDYIIKEQCLKPQTYPVQHFPHGSWIPRLDAGFLLRVKLASGGIKRVWDSIVSPPKKRYALVGEDISRRLHSGLLRYQGRTLGNDHGDFMRGVLNGDPQCCLRGCCNNQWGRVHRFRPDSGRPSARVAIQHIVADLNGFLVEKDDGSNGDSNGGSNGGDNE